MANPVPTEKSIQFSLVAGGPFHTMLLRFGLLVPDRQASRPLVESILLLLALAWSWLRFYYVSTALQILIAATAPFLVVVASQIPLTEILKWLPGAIL